MIIISVILSFTIISLIALNNILASNPDGNGFKGTPVMQPVKQFDGQTAMDELDDQMVGLPTKPLTIHSAKLCDENKNIMLLRSWVCKDDPTCRKCSLNSIERFSKVKSAFDVALKRIDLTIYKDVKSIVIMAVNFGQLEYFLNWACSVENDNPQGFVLVIPTDTESYNVLKKYKFNVIDPNTWVSKLHLSKDYNPKYANIGPHADINNILLLAVNYVLINQPTKNVLLHDVDQVWVNGGPLGYLERNAYRREIMGMLSPYDQANGGINTGFIYFTNNERTKLLTQSIVNVAPLKDKSDQILINTVVRHRFFRTIVVKYLPQSIFTRYSGSKQTVVSNKTLVFHAVSINKKRNLKKYDLWFFGNDICKFKI